MTTSPPDKWTLSTGVWGTDADQNTAVTQQGGYSLEMKNTTPAAAVDLRSDYLPTVPNAAYLINVSVRATSVAAGNTVLIGLEWYTAAKASISTDTVYNAVLPAINTWYPIAGVYSAPSTAAFRRIILRKANTAFTAYWDSARTIRTSRAFFVARSDNQTSVASTDQVGFNDETYDHGGLLLKTGSITAFANAGGGQVTVTSTGHGMSNGNWVTITGTTNYDGTYAIANVAANTFEITAAWVADDGTGTWTRRNVATIIQDGWHEFNAGVGYSGMNDQEALAVDFYKNGAFWMRGDYDTASVNAQQGGLPITSGPAYMARGDEIDVRITHGHVGPPATITLLGAAKTAPLTWFSGKEVDR